MVLQAPLLGATGFAVAGGESRRMGKDKALLPWGKTTLLDHTLQRLRLVCSEVRILSGERPRYEDRGVPVDTDVTRGAGPLGGVYTGLLRLKDGLGVFLAVDIPFVPYRLLRRLVELAGTHDAVVPLSPGGPEPLCAVYSARCLKAIAREIEAGQLKMTSFFHAVRVRGVSPEELAEFGNPEELFRNVNTIDDYSGLLP
jgi:molybdopterin-guanine dinucleotide biosynthesis protein A